MEKNMETREKGKERKKSTYNNKQDSQNPKKKEEKQKKSSRCPYSRKCGGCQLIDVPYEKQLKEKEKNSQISHRISIGYS